MNLALYIFRTSRVPDKPRLRPSFVALRASYEDELAEVLTIRVPDNALPGDDFLTVNLVTFSPDMLLRSYLSHQTRFPVLDHHIEKISLQEILT